MPSDVAVLTDEPCPLVARVVELTEPRTRWELALVVVEWVLAWRPDGADEDGPPVDLFRDDELDVAASLEADELFAAAECLLAALANHTTSRRTSQRILWFGGYLGSQRRRAYVCPPMVRRVQARASRSRRHVGGSRRARSAARSEPREPDPALACSRRGRLVVLRHADRRRR